MSVLSPSQATTMKKHNAILKFVRLPETEVAVWRTKETKGRDEDLSTMTLEQRGDFLMNEVHF